jgi:hypothetical protein
MTRRTTLPTLLAGLVLLAGCNDDQAPYERIAGPQRQIVDGGQPHHYQGIEEEFAALAREAPGSAGFFLDSDGRLNIYLTDLSQEHAARAALMALFPRSPLARVRPRIDLRGLRVHKAQYDFVQLAEWRDRISPILFGIREFSMLDLDERRNRIVIGLENLSRVGSIELELARLGIPPAAVLFEQRQITKTLATLSDRRRPVRGGQLIENRWPSGREPDCTLGFNVEIAYVLYFFTNDHCTPTRGANDFAAMYQPSVQTGNFIGSEYSDPPYFSDARCGLRLCRYSDAALFRYGATQVDLGGIMRTWGVNYSAGLGSRTIDEDRPRFKIGSEQMWPYAGQTLHKVGVTSGWTAGGVTRTCVHVPVEGNLGLLCQDFAGFYSLAGDSGSPVFSFPGGLPESDGEPVAIVGLMWGGDTATGESGLSSYSNLRWDFGHFVVYPGYCEPATC